MSLLLEFLDTPRGRLLVTGIGPGLDEANQVAVVVPAFLEEMNLSRHFVAQQARRLALHGWHTVILDLTGTGDSEGDLREVSLADWYADFDCLASWLRQRGVSRVWFWAIRFGALLLPTLWQRWQEAVNGILLWQPILSGALYRKQFLRLKLAAELEGGNVNSLMQQAQAQGMLEVAGYPLSAALLEEMATLTFSTASCTVRPLCWIEVVAPGVPPPMAVSGQWEELAPSCLQTVEGPAFWNTLEIYRFDGLLVATESLLQTALSAARSAASGEAAWV